MDRAIVRPAATAYRDVLPSPVRTGITNFFHNLQDAWSVVNNILQLKGEAAGNSFPLWCQHRVRVGWCAGHCSSQMRIERHTEGFGDTLGFWGVRPGPYLVLPILGPSTTRDTAAMFVDSQGNLLDGVEHIPTRNSATFLKMVNQRAQLLQATAMLDQWRLIPTPSPAMRFCSAAAIGVRRQSTRI